MLKKYKAKQILKACKQIKLDDAYEEYIYEGIKRAENQIKNGAKSYSEEEFIKEMRTKYGCII